ncbi:hypothetical protein ACLBR5_13870 [Escherichia coli]
MTLTACVYFSLETLFARIDDIDLNLEDFVQRVNADIVNEGDTWPLVMRALSTSVLTACWQANWLTRSCTKPSLMPLK